MADFEMPENSEFSLQVRKFETTDPAHADLFNNVTQALLNNDAFLKLAAEQLKKDIGAQQTSLDSQYQQLTAYVGQKISDLVNGAPAALDTLKELADAIANHKSIMDALDTAIGKKANEAEFDSHVKDTTKHITAAERDKWNNGSHNYGTCSTAAATADKTVSCDGFKLATGAEIAVKFTITNTAANPTLNVNSTGAKAIYYRGAAITAGYLAANRTYTFRYNGMQYDLVGDIDTNSNTTYSAGNQLELSGTVFKLKDYCSTITDWNNAVTNGFYMGNAAANAPSSTGWYYGIVIAHSTSHVRQIAYAFATGNDVAGGNTYRYERIKNDNAWGAWVNTSVRKAVPNNAVFTDTTYPIYDTVINAEYKEKFRTQIKGSSSSGPFISAIRNNTANVDQSPQFGSGLGFGHGDTNGYLYTDWTSRKAFIGGGNGDVLRWIAKIAFADAVELKTVNLNDYKTEGDLYYAAGGNTVTNKPSGVNGFALRIIRASGGGYLQRLYDPDNHIEWNRYWNGSVWGAWAKVNAGKADQLTTARNIGCIGDVVGSTSFDGSGNKNMSVLRRGCTVGQSGGDNTKPYFKFASISVNAPYEDRLISFHVTCGYAESTTRVGILTAHFRTKSDRTWDTGELVWECATYGIDTNSFILVHSDTAPCIVELWAKIDISYRCYHFDVISEGDRTGRGTNIWTLHNSTLEGSSGVTSGYSISNSILQKIKNPTAGNAVSADVASKLSNTRYIDGLAFDGSGSITHYGTCSTAASQAEKIVVCPGFVRMTGAIVTVKFTTTNTASSPTLNVNGTGASTIVYRGNSISGSDNILLANRLYTFVYTGSRYELVGDALTSVRSWSLERSQTGYNVHVNAYTRIVSVNLFNHNVSNGATLVLSGEPAVDVYAPCTIIGSGVATPGLVHVYKDANNPGKSYYEIGTQDSNGNFVKFTGTNKTTCSFMYRIA